MPLDFQNLSFAYRRSPDQDGDTPVRRRVVIVGAGPVGLTCAIDLAQQGIGVTVLDDDDTQSTGSRAICFAKRTLEIWDRLGCGQRMVDKGVSWNVGRVHFQDELVYRFDLQDEPGHHRPAFINLQQYYVEAFLLEAAAALPLVDLRWKNRVVGLDQDDLGATLTVETPDGPYRLVADHVVACDGSRSPMRKLLALKTDGHSFRDRFLIADIRMSPETSATFPVERWFWFDPPFHRGQSVLLHRQPDDVWRIDFQLGWDADPVAEREPARVTARVRTLLEAAGRPDAQFTLEWSSVYTFSCQRMERFRHGRVIFAGDAAHGVSPFGARGANSGVQDADNLAWKLRLVVEGRAPDRLLDTYDAERVVAADENILASTRATDFITPKSAISRTFRNAVLDLARAHPFARRLVNSGRLSVPATLDDSSLNTPDRDPFDGALRPGAPCMDAPIGIDGWLLDALGKSFTLLLFADEAIQAAAWRATIDAAPLPLALVVVMPAAAAMTPATNASATGGLVLHDRDGTARRRYDAASGTVYLIRPDQHVAARWRHAEPADVTAALDRALCLDQETR